MLSNVESQGQLNFVHKTAETSKTAARAARPKAQKRRQAILNHLLLAGGNGHTRHELAAKMAIPLSSSCSLANAMLADGELHETGETRLSPFGMPAKILTLPPQKSGVGA